VDGAGTCAGLGTVALIGASYALFILQQLTQSTPLLHMVLLLPLLAMATAPLQLASVHTSGAFLTVAMLYLGIPWLCSTWAFGRALAERSRCTWASSP